jgi:uncharacterized caspase-like protein
MRFTVIAVSILSAALLNGSLAFSASPFAKSYAIVVGIDTYSHSKWQKLSYAVKDADGIAKYLRSQGFEVRELREGAATRQAIVSAVEDYLAPRVTARDRVLFFFAGHGVTRLAGDEQRGYLVPFDATDSFASLLPMSQLRDFSSTISIARHQLFVLDACFGGLVVTRAGTVDPRTPNYIDEVTKRRARQVLTAGGANQRVADGGPDGHSLFTGQLLKALREGLADTNGDGYITFSELSSYIQVAASHYNQTPGVSALAGHEQGEFVFLNTTRKLGREGPKESRDAASSAWRSEDVDEVYLLLKIGQGRLRAA